MSLMARGCRDQRIGWADVVGERVTVSTNIFFLKNKKNVEMRMTKMKTSLHSLLNIIFCQKGMRALYHRTNVYTHALLIVHKGYHHADDVCR